MNEHGVYHLDVIGNVIVCEFSDAFNVEGASEFLRDFRMIVDQMNGEAFAVVSNGVDCDGGTPEAYDLVNQYNEWLATTNCYAKALVFRDTLSRNIYRDRVPAIEQQREFLQEFFSYEEAIEWVKSKDPNLNN